MKIVVKIGGSLLDKGVPTGILSDLKVLKKQHEFVLVHGGAKIVTNISIKLGKEPRFITNPKGFRSRYTDKESAEIFTMVMAGLINKKVVSNLQNQGVKAIGLSGLDGALILATKKKQLIIVDDRGKKMLIDGDYSGQIKSINTELLDLLTCNEYVPVLASVAMGEAGEYLNIDGDRLASFVARAINADSLILLTDVDGVYLNNSLVEKLTIIEAENYVKEIGAGMITKLYAAIEAIRGGVPEIIIASGLSDNSPIISALKHKFCTVISR